MLAFPQRLRTAGLGVVSQGLNSASNFLLVALVLRNSTLEQFGVFSLGYVGLSLVVSVGRARASAPLLLVQDITPGGQRTAYALAARSGALGAVVLGLFGVAMGSPELVALSMVTPLVLVQDAHRYLAFASSAPGRAVGSDLVWLVVQLSATAVLHLVGSFSAAAAIAAWAMGGCASLLWPAICSYPIFAVRPCSAFLASTAEMRRSTTIDALAGSLSNQILLPGLALTQGAGGVGLYRGAVTLLAPVTMIYMGMNPLAIRRAALSFPRISSGVSALGTTLLCVTVLGTALSGTLHFVPTSVIGILFGNAAIDSLDLVPLALVQTVALLSAAAAGVLVRLWVSPTLASKVRVATVSIEFAAVTALGLLGLTAAIMGSVLAATGGLVASGYLLRASAASPSTESGRTETDRATAISAEAPSD